MNIVTVKTATGYSTYDADDVPKEKVVPKCSNGEHEWQSRSKRRVDIGGGVTGQVIYEECVKCKVTKNAEVVLGLTCPELRQLV